MMDGLLLDERPLRRGQVLKNAPVVWFAIAATAGIAVDRFFSVPIVFSLAVAGAALLSGLIVSRRFANAYLLLGAAAVGAAYLHYRQSNDGGIAILATAEGTPVRLRGFVVAPVMRVAGADDVFQTIPHPESSKLVVDVVEPASGRIVAYVTGKVADVYPGDEVELNGRLHLPRAAGNPGEFDPVQDLRDQDIGAVLSAPKSPDAVRLIAHRWPGSITGWLGRLHGACKSILEERLSAEPGLAAALLLGDGSGLTRPEWDKFLKSGVVHALAISGQHLAVLAMFLALLRRLTFVRLTPATIGITIILIGYALLTGGRAPAMRAAWMVLVVSFAVLLRRPTLRVNTLAMAWLIVIFVQPADVFQIGCLLSFLAVGIIWFVTPWLDQPAEPDPFAEPRDDSRVRRWLGAFGNATRLSYAIGALVWLGVTPLVADRFHVVAPIALLIGPPVVLATSVALIAGFLLLLTSSILGPLAAPFAWITDASLYCCETIIDWGLQLPGASFMVVELPTYWVVVFYLGLLVALVVPSWRSWWIVLVGAVWMLFGLALGLGYLHRPVFRVAFLSVGHGGCTVIETSSGRVLVYDAGAMSGPDLTRRIVIPYLHSRGLTRIDDLFVSHADLDHFSGVPDLLDRVAVARVTLTPSFADRRTPAVRRVMADLKRRGVPTRIVKAGDAERIDDVKLDVLHPPAIGPDGKENARSLVMLVRNGSFAMLLTGDLEDAGLEQALRLPPPGLDVFMAPHHGGMSANPERLAKWAKPRIAISNQGRPRGVKSPAGLYEVVGARFMTTHQHGAIEIDVRDGDIWVETFRTKESIRLGPIAVR